MDQAEVAERASEEMRNLAARRAKERAKNARWDLNVAIFLFAVLIMVIILLFQGIRTEIVGPIAIFGLAMVWLVGWRRGRELYDIFYDEELAKLEQDLRSKEKGLEEVIEETVEEKVQKALRQRWR